MKRFLVRLSNYEYWPMWAFYLPLFFYFVYRGIINRNFFFFTNVNTGFDPMGGLFFDSKSTTDKFIPQQFRPGSILVRKGEIADIDSQRFKYPLIIKPDQGERGKRLCKIDDKSRLNDILILYDEDILIQEFNSFPLEFSVFVVYDPDLCKHKILSLTEKKFFKVSGDGYSNFSILIKSSHRGIYAYKNLLELSGIKEEYIPAKGEEILVHQIGNHNKGTEFIDAGLKISPAMQERFAMFLKDCRVFEYGRFDVKTKSLKDLETFEKICFIEFNGLAAEPTVVYDSRTGYFKALKTFVNHWKSMEKISKYNKLKGVKPQRTAVVVKKIVKRHLGKSE